MSMTRSYRADKAQNRLVLVDEPTGQIVGEMGGEHNIKEDKGVAQVASSDVDNPYDITNKEPVVVEISDSGAVRVSPLRAMTEKYGQSDSSIIKGP